MPMVEWPVMVFKQNFAKCYVILIANLVKPFNNFRIIQIFTLPENNFPKPNCMRCSDSSTSQCMFLFSDVDRRIFPLPFGQRLSSAAG